jgi:hypothetical protein
VLNLGDGGGAGEGELRDGLQLVRLLVLVRKRKALKNPRLLSLQNACVYSCIHSNHVTTHLPLRTNHLQKAIKDMLRTGQNTRTHA